jgi:hypothetical protein
VAEATIVSSATQVPDGAIPFTAGAAFLQGDVIQMADGRAGVVVANVSAGGQGSAYVDDRFRASIQKTTGVVILDGGRVYWDHSASLATFRKVSDRDFYLGRAIGDASSTSSQVQVALNTDPPDDLNLARDPYLTAPTGTQALGGFLPPARQGGALRFNISATNEAQKLDALSKDGFAIGANAIVEVAFTVTSDGAGTVVDVNLGVASATHATDADAIANHLFVHLDANATSILIQSKDPGTTVAATDTTTDYVEGALSRKEIWFDLRNPADVQVYVDGVNVLPASVFRLDAVATTLFLLAHIEKTVSVDTYDIDIDWLRARFAEQ